MDGELNIPELSDEFDWMLAKLTPEEVDEMFGLNQPNEQSQS